LRWSIEAARGGKVESMIHPSLRDGSNPVRQLAQKGQLVWLDDIQRSLIAGGDLARLIAEDGLAGITSNPVIFEHAIRESPDYDAAIAALRARRAGPGIAYENLALDDVRMAADVFRPLFEDSRGEAGFVSLEVSPHLARDTTRTVEEAKRFWRALDRPNVFIKVPGTKEGLPAITSLVAEGINVNVTLLFSVERYREVAEAHWAGLEQRLSGGLSVQGVRSVASFFLSRIDALLDPRLKEMKSERAARLVGRAAVACAKTAYAAFNEMRASTRWQALMARGASPQKLLWASTGTKDPAYSDVKYVAELVGPETVITMPRKTLSAFKDHGRVGLTLERGVDEARAVQRDLIELGFDMDVVAAELEEQGIRLFVEAFDRLQAALRDRLATAA
jgi:transaldolase